jgi:hypothetical protein
MNYLEYRPLIENESAHVQPVGGIEAEGVIHRFDFHDRQGESNVVISTPARARPGRLRLKSAPTADLPDMSSPFGKNISVFQKCKSAL